MRLFLVALLMLGGGFSVARAETPEEVAIEGKYDIAVGESKTLRFPSTVKTVSVTSPGIVEATAQTDRVITLTGIASGTTTLLVYGDEGRRLFSALLSVNPDAGHIVRLYGQAKVDAIGGNGGNSKDYISFYCNATFCGRSDKDLPPMSQSGSSTTITRQLQDGSTIQRNINSR